MRDLHTHSVFSDGKNTLEEMTLAAIKKGMTEIGFSDHSYTAFDERYCIKKDKTKEYISEVKRLKEKYSDRINILCGIEQDYYAGKPTEVFDYVIGSVHYVNKDGYFFPIDESAEILLNCTKKYYNGDIYSLAEDYFSAVGDVVNKTGASIVGHFDLITKFNEKNHLIDENDPRYISAWKSAVDKLLSQSAIFEINTGAISRGYRTSPYPSKEIRDYIKSRGGKFIFSSDSHCCENLCFDFDKFVV